MEDKSIFDEAGLNPNEWELVDSPPIIPAADLETALQYPAHRLPVGMLSIRAQSERPQAGIPVRALWPVQAPGKANSNSAAQTQARIQVSPLTSSPVVQVGSRGQLSAISVSPRGTPQLAAKQPIIDPTQSTILSAGNRISSLTTQQAFVSTATSITFYWDGTHGSQILKIYRDDGTISAPVSNNLAITGLSASTKYFFYPYYDEVLMKVVFPTGDGTGVGSPAVAFTASNIVAAQQQIMRGRISLFAAASQGITTPASGSGGGSGGGGGGGRQLF